MDTEDFRLVTSICHIALTVAVCIFLFNGTPDLSDGVRDLFIKLAK